MSGSTSEAIGRFVNTMTGGKVVPKKLLEVRNGKVGTALDAMAAQITRLGAAGVKSQGLVNNLTSLRQARSHALSLQNDAERRKALEKVKQDARKLQKLAEQIVNITLERLGALIQEGIEAGNAINQANTAIQQTPDQNEKGRFLVALQSLRDRLETHSGVREQLQINPAITELQRVRDEAVQLAADVTAAKPILQQRITRLAEINKELGKLRKLNQKVVDQPLVNLVTDKLADLTTRRDALAQAPLGQLQAELAKVDALLQDISGAVTESEPCAKWGEVKPVRDMIRYACNLYIVAAGPNKHNKVKLGQDSLALLQKLTDVEDQACGNPPPPNPLQAYIKFVTKINETDYENLKKEYYNQILRGPLLAKAELLEKNDPNGAEAQMKLALDSSVYETRMLEAWNSGEAFGSPILGKLSPGEAVAIYTYTSDDYKKINGRLIGYQPPANQVEEAQIKIMTEQATKALAKLDNYVGITKRGDKDFNGADAQFTKDNVFKIKAFWSTGVGFSFPGMWQITINGKTGKDVKPISNYPKEAEVLFPPGTEFKVIARDDTEAPDTIYVTVEQV